MKTRQHMCECCVRHPWSPGKPEDRGWTLIMCYMLCEKTIHVYVHVICFYVIILSLFTVLYIAHGVSLSLVMYWLFCMVALDSLGKTGGSWATCMTCMGCMRSGGIRCPSCVMLTLPLWKPCRRVEEGGMYGEPWYGMDGV
ncbi:hypothetical protein AAFF_G00407230 [Aldrovandia affinis]|uniref:Uncharacterized protein n=1 Tax=Aldrovandia affinis TaxID=143900 RepID=A0AAD7VYP9_9TELE|nr:hypothetical protein AAFF_G00407230 [Aldrovandia affinis]